MPVLSLGAVVFGHLTIFLEPNPDDPLNKGALSAVMCASGPAPAHAPSAEAAKLMIEKPQEFQRNVKQSLRGTLVVVGGCAARLSCLAAPYAGGYVMGRNFPTLIK